MNLYLVGMDQELYEPMLIKASSEEHARETYIKNVPMCDSFLEDMYGKAINFCFAEKFWYPLFKDIEDPTEALIKRSEPEFIMRTMLYFGHENNFADIFLNHWFNDEHEHECDCFPSEMIRFMWEKELKTENWSQIKMINLDLLKIIEAMHD